MASATAVRSSANLIIPSTFKLADRIGIQQECIRNKNYIIAGRLTALVFEKQRSISGFSQSRPRWNNSYQSKALKDQPGLHPFSESQAVLWAGITLDWLTNDDSPVLAVSRDHQDLLLPFGLPALPKIPDPRWVPAHAQHSCPKSTKTGCKGCVPPRMPQLLVGCPVVGDRVSDKITDRTGRTYGVIHPITISAISMMG